MNRIGSTPVLNYAGRQDSAVSSGDAAPRPRRRRRPSDNDLDDSGHSYKSLDLDVETSIRSAPGAVTWGSGNRWDEHNLPSSQQQQYTTTPLHHRPSLRSTRSCNTTPMQPRPKLHSYSGQTPQDGPLNPSYGGSLSQRQHNSSASVRSLRARRKSPHSARTTRSDLFNDSLENPPLYSKEEAHHHNPRSQISYAMDEGDVVSPYRYRGRKPLVDFLHMNMSLEQMITLMFVFMIVCFLAGSHQLSMSAANEIEDVTLNENTLLFHLKNVEHHSIKFADTMRQLQEMHDGSSVEQVKLPEPDVNTDILEHQIGQLKEVEEQLKHEVDGLQKHVQASSKNAILHHYKVSDVHVFLEVELDMGEGGAQRHNVGIQLWKDAPHASWTFLQQLTNGVWDGASLSKDDGRVFLASPKGGAEEMQPTVTFSEKGVGKRANKRFTVSMTDRGLVFHLQDNSRPYTNKESSFSLGSVAMDNFMILQNMIRDSKSGTVKIVKGSASGAGF